ncbi:MAG: type 1 glutamine amidotransferase domain-containing protein [Ketobacter sp.]
MSDQLHNIKVAFLATDNFEQVELTQPWQAILDEGGIPELISLSSGQIKGCHHDQPGDTFRVDKTIKECAISDYAGLVLPGGVFNPDALRTHAEAVRMVQEFVYTQKPVAAICHGPWLLVEADVVRNRTLTSWPSLQTDIKNAGGTWVDEEVVADDGIITSRKPEDLDAFSAHLIEALFSVANPDKKSQSTPVVETAS